MKLAYIFMNFILDFLIVEDILPLKMQSGPEAETKEFCDFIIVNMVLFIAIITSPLLRDSSSIFSLPSSRVDSTYVLTN